MDPATQTAEQRAAAATVQLPDSQATVIDALDSSALVRGILGDPAVDALVAVRRYEIEHFGALPADELAARFRLAWSL